MMTGGEKLTRVDALFLNFGADGEALAAARSLRASYAAYRGGDVQLHIVRVDVPVNREAVRDGAGGGRGVANGVTFGAGVGPFDEVARLEYNDGYGANMNAAVAAVTARDAVDPASGALLLLNCDLVFEEGFFGALCRAYRDDAVLGAALLREADAGGAVRVVEALGMRVSARGRHLQNGAGLALDVAVAKLAATQPHDKGGGGALAGGALAVDAVPGTAMMMSRGLFARLDGFEPSWFLYFEDADLCRRAREMGARVVVVTDALAMHAGHRSVRDDARMYYATRSHVLYQRRWGRRNSSLRGALHETIDLAAVVGYNALYALRRRDSSHGRLATTAERGERFRSVLRGAWSALKDDRGR